MKNSNKTTISVIENTLFLSRWLLLAVYMGLSIGLAIYCFKFTQELWHMISSVGTITTEEVMLGILGLVDIAMVANLVIMVNIGSYSIFIREINPDKVNNRPRFMNNITAGGLKTKLATSLIGVSSIHLLKTFIEAASHDKAHLVTREMVIIMVGIHLVFVISAFALAKIDATHTHNTFPAKDEDSHN